MTEFGVARSVDLVAGGSDIAVTAENRQEYIQLVCKYKLDKQIAAQSRAFFTGLSDIIDQKCAFFSRPICPQRIKYPPRLSSRALRIVFASLDSICSIYFLFFTLEVMIPSYPISTPHTSALTR